jgi:hypothetical protein
MKMSHSTRRLLALLAALVLQSGLASAGVIQWVVPSIPGNG